MRIASRWLRIGPPAAEGGEANPVGSSSTSGMSARSARSTPGRVSSVARSVSSAVRLPGSGMPTASCGEPSIEPTTCPATLASAPFTWATVADCVIRSAISVRAIRIPSGCHGHLRLVMARVRVDVLDRAERRPLPPRRPSRPGSWFTTTLADGAVAGGVRSRHADRVRPLAERHLAGEGVSVARGRLAVARDACDAAARVARDAAERGGGVREPCLRARGLDRELGRRRVGRGRSGGGGGGGGGGTALRRQSVRARLQRLQLLRLLREERAPLLARGVRPEERPLAGAHLPLEGAQPLALGLARARPARQPDGARRRPLRYRRPRDRASGTTQQRDRRSPTAGGGSPSPRESKRDHRIRASGTWLSPQARLAGPLSAPVGRSPRTPS